MAELVTSIQTTGPNTTPDNDIANLSLEMSMFAPAPITASDVLSRDVINDLKLGSDGKLVSQPPDIDFLAFYLSARN